MLFFSEYRACLERGLTELEALYRRSLERSDPVEMAIAYVRRHYMEPITLAPGEFRMISTVQQ